MIIYLHLSYHICSL